MHRTFERSNSCSLFRLFIMQIICCCDVSGNPALPVPRLFVSLSDKCHDFHQHGYVGLAASFLMSRKEQIGWRSANCTSVRADNGSKWETDNIDIDPSRLAAGWRYRGARPGKQDGEAPPLLYKDERQCHIKLLHTLFLPKLNGRRRGKLAPR